MPAVIQMKKLEPVFKELDAIVNDRSVPKNIRRACLESMDALRNEKESMDIRINTATSLLDETTNDPNIPMHTRTQIWNIVSMLESVNKPDTSKA